jgi:hypothetical protein
MSLPTGSASTFAQRPNIPAIRAQLILERLRAAPSMSRPLWLVATGRTGSGKTSLGNRLLGIDYFLSHGRQDCTREINLIPFPSGLNYGDLPGVASDDRLENLNRVALGMAQVDDYPRVEALSIARFVPDSPPAFETHPLERRDVLVPRPDLLFYVIGLGAPLTRGEQGYLRDLLRSYANVVFILNVFSHAPAPEANVEDVVTRIRGLHRAARPGERDPDLVLMNCRTGEGIAELLQAAQRHLPPAQARFLRDLLDYQEERTPIVFADRLRGFFLHLATQAAPLRPSERIQPDQALHRLVRETWNCCGGLREDNAALGQAFGGRYAHILRAETAPSTPLPDLAGADQSTNEPTWFDLARFLIDQEIDRINKEFLPSYHETCAALRIVRGGVADQAQAVQDAYTARCNARTEQFRRNGERLDQLGAQHRPLLERFQSEYSAYERESQQFQSDIALFNARTEEYSQDRRRTNDRIESYNEFIEAGNRGVYIDDYTRRRLASESDTIDRENSRLESRLYHLQREEAGLRQRGAYLDAVIARLKALSEELQRLESAIETCLAENRAVFATARADGQRMQRWATGEDARHEAFDRVWQTTNEELQTEIDTLNERLNTIGAEIAALAVNSATTGEPRQAAADQMRALHADLKRLGGRIAIRRRVLEAEGVLLQANGPTNDCLTLATTDHFNDDDERAYRGSTYQVLGSAGVAHLLTLAQLLLETGGVGAGYAERHAWLLQRLGPLPAVVDPEQLATHLVPRLRELFPAEFEQAVTRLTYFAR